MRVSILALLLLTPTFAHALEWDLQDRTWRYDLTLDDQPSPAPPRRPLLAPLTLLAPEHLVDARAPRLQPLDPGDLVWYYTLSLPAGDDGASIRDRFDMAGGVVSAQGAVDVQGRGRRMTLRTELTLTGDAEAWLREGSLQIERRFDTRAGLLQAAQFVLELTVSDADGNPTTARWTGHIQPSDPLEPDTPDFASDVQRAIEEGTRWLQRETVSRLNSYRASTDLGHQSLGRLALPAFALLRSGVDPDDLDPVFAWLTRQPLQGTYSVSLYILALEARHVTRRALPPRAHSRSVARFDRRDLPDDDLARIALAARWLLAARKDGEGWWSYYALPVEQPARPGTRERNGADPGDLGEPIGHDAETPSTSGDHSNSQFAVLALHAAHAAGVEIDPEVWREIYDESLRTQMASGEDVDLADVEYAANSPLSFDPRDRPLEGATRTRGGTGANPREFAVGQARGWAYGTSSPASSGNAYGSMTAAGLSSLAIARQGLEDSLRLSAEQDREALYALRDGLAWYARHFDPARNARRAADNWYFYYLYSLEKAMDLLGVERLGAFEWWREGAAQLLARQDRDGSWNASIEDTAMALLFLNRATLPAKLEIRQVERVATGDRDPSLWDLATIPEVGQVRLRQVLRALLDAGPREARERLELAEAAFEALAEEERPRLLPELSPLLGSPHRATRRWAEGLCERWGGSTDPATLTRVSTHFEDLRRAGLTHDTDAIPEVRAILRDPQSTVPLKRHTMIVLGRLRAAEAAGDVLEVLSSGPSELHEVAASTLLGLVGPRHPLDLDASSSERRDQLRAWERWWDAERDAVILDTQARRAVDALADPNRAEAAAQRLRTLDAAAVRHLIDALRRPSTRDRAHALLIEITQQHFPADPAPWLDWHENR